MQLHARSPAFLRAGDATNQSPRIEPQNLPLYIPPTRFKRTGRGYYPRDETVPTVCPQRRYQFRTLAVESACGRRGSENHCCILKDGICKAQHSTCKMGSDDSMSARCKSQWILAIGDLIMWLRVLRSGTATIFPSILTLMHWSITSYQRELMEKFESYQRWSYHLLKKSNSNAYSREDTFGDG